MINDATIVDIFDYKKDDNKPILRAYVDNSADNLRREEVRFTDDKLAKDMGLTDAVVRTPHGRFTVNDGVLFVENLWRMFTGNTYISAQFPHTGKINPMEDIDG